RFSRDWSSDVCSSDLVRTYLYGRRMYETMVFWETAHTRPDLPPHILQYARDWQAAEKVVYSTTLESVSSAKTRIERTFDPDAVQIGRASCREGGWSRA